MTTWKVKAAAKMSNYYTLEVLNTFAARKNLQKAKNLTCVPGESVVQSVVVGGRA